MEQAMKIDTIINNFFDNTENISLQLPKYHNTFLGNTNPAKPTAPTIENSQTNLLTVFQSPLIGFADADDPLFLTYKNRYEATYNAFMPPHEWLPSAKTVISIFLPFSDHIVNSNKIHPKLPSYEWTYGRYDGQQIINNFSKYLEDQIHQLGYDAIAPSISKNFKATYGYLDPAHQKDNFAYTSNWSERHVAFAAGLGTFSLCKGIITEKGMAGRFTSIITNIRYPPTERKYTGIYEYCTMCGQCLRNCPPTAITFKHGKNHPKCATYQRGIKKLYDPRFGCGKCQVDVPCSRQIPSRK